MKTIGLLHCPFHQCLPLRLCDKTAARHCSVRRSRSLLRKMARNCKISQLVPAGLRGRRDCRLLGIAGWFNQGRQLLSAQERFTENGRRPRNSSSREWERPAQGAFLRPVRRRLLDHRPGRKALLVGARRPSLATLPLDLVAATKDASGTLPANHRNCRGKGLQCRANRAFALLDWPHDTPFPTSPVSRQVCSGTKSGNLCLGLIFVHSIPFSPTVKRPLLSIVTLTGRNLTSILLPGLLVFLGGCSSPPDLGAYTDSLGSTDKINSRSSEDAR